MGRRRCSREPGARGLWRDRRDSAPAPQHSARSTAARNSSRDSRTDPAMHRAPPRSVSCAPVPSAALPIPVESTRPLLLRGLPAHALPADGLPAAALDDPIQHVPLLSCLANQVLGFYGNCMIMPVSIPSALAASGGGNGDGTAPPLTTGRVQEALTAFHRSAFAPPVSHISLPTSGVLGEAVLGHCPSAEKIDLTRFWNWKDSESEKAPDIGTVPIREALNPGALTVSTPPVPTSIINTVTGSDSPTTAASVISELVKEGKNETPFD